MRGTSELVTVSRFEADLLAILQGFLGHLPRSQLLPLLSRTNTRPKCLSRSCLTLIEDMLAKGSTLLIARQGWQQERFLRSEQMTTGRLWERTAPEQLGLSFSRQTIDFLLWATASDAGQRGEVWSPGGPLEIGDRWLLCTAYATLHETNIGLLWSERQPWRVDPFCRLLYASDFDTPGGQAPDFTPWLTPAGIGLLEASQQRLAERWVAMEQAKARFTTVQQLRAAALGQSRILEAYLMAIDKLGRRDLARFLLIGGARLFPQTSSALGASGDPALRSLRLAERQQVQRDALVVARTFEQLDQWQNEALRIGYFDDGYQAAQLWKLDWEAYKGAEVLALARERLAATQWL